MEFVGFDFEGSGVYDGYPESPVQIGVSIMRNMLIEPALCSFLKREKPVHPQAFRVHGISHMDCQAAPRLLDFWTPLQPYLKMIPVAHNAGTEKKFLQSAFPLLPVRSFPWVDTLKLSRFAFPSLKDHSLESVCAHLQLEGDIALLVPGKGWHDALFDASASLVLLRHLLTLPGWEKVPLSWLQNPGNEQYHRLRRHERFCRLR